MEWNKEFLQKPMWDNEISNREQKEKIAKEIAKIANDGDVIGFGSGSTSYLAAIEIENRIQNEGIKFLHHMK